MSLIFLMPSHEWDFPVFKVLAKNDTGSAECNGRCRSVTGRRR